MRKVRSGFTIIEVLFVTVILSVLMIGIFTLVNRSWQSYEALWWQSKVDQEARQALDDVCDYVRMSGSGIDATAVQSTGYQVHPQSSDSILIFFPISGSNNLVYAVQQGDRTDSFYLVRSQGGGNENPPTVAQYINRVGFEYEYRLPAQTIDQTGSTRQFRRVSVPTDDQAHLVSTIYVTIDASVQPYGERGATYKRSMTSAVHLRAPYNQALPPSQVIQ